MKWQDARARYPDQWLLIEAINARSEAGRRILDDLLVLDTFVDSTKALQRYAQLHHETPNREMYVFHASRDTLDITERQWLGVRVAG